MTILFDFDGVLIDSMPVRELGFRKVLEDYPAKEIDKLIDFHNSNGGLSRYVKFRFFFENILEKIISDKEINTLASSFSKIMLELLANPDLLINDSLDFVTKNYSDMDLHIVSGSDGDELRTLCVGLGIANYFKSINGSPSPKTDLVRDLISRFSYDKNSTVLIGDSTNDLEAAVHNQIRFIGYNNPKLKTQGCEYLNSFKDFIIELSD